MSCVREAQAGLTRAGLTGEVLVVDNGSTDGSAELARSAGARVIAEERRGYGHAVGRGVAEARGDVTVTADADGTYDLTRLGEAVALVLDGTADLVIASRFGQLTRGSMPLLHRLVGTPALSFALRRACRGLRIRDSQSGYRAFKTRTLRALGLQAGGFELCSEMLIRASQEGLRVVERPLGYRPRVGRSKLATMADGWRHLQLILLLAPQLLLFWPGVVLLALGLALSVLSLLYPVGFQLGALHWQPIFLAPILIVLGTMGTLAGAVVTYHSTLASPRAVAHFALVGDRRFTAGCITTGVIALLAGLVLEVVLFAFWVGDGTSPSRALALAGIAQALVIAGVVASVFGVLYRILVGQSAYRNHRTAADLPTAEADAEATVQPGGVGSPVAGQE